MNWKRKTSLLLLMLSAWVALASPARRGTFLVTQPDGSSFMASLNGDEFCRILTTQDGCVISQDKDGWYQYSFINLDGRIMPSGYNVGQKAPDIIVSQSRNIPYSALSFRSSMLRAQARKAVTRRAGNATRAEKTVKHGLVILAQFPDRTFEEESTRLNEFSELVCSDGYTKDGATGSVKDYFQTQLGDIFDFEFTVCGIVTVSKTHDYYGNDDGEEGRDAHPDELAKEACILASSEVDFSKFDDDGDGEVDNVFVIVAGKSQAEGADQDCIWPHQWYIHDKVILNGKTLGCYAMSTELSVVGQKSTGQLLWGRCGIGTICHEYGHTLGLFDVYDTDGDGSGGNSDCMWFQTSVMDGGSYNNKGMTPPFYNALDRELMGSGKREILKEGAYNLEPISENGRYLILENPKDDYEFFLFECRKQKSWDTYIGGSGLAIYHIDMTGNKAGYSDQAEAVVTALYRWNNNEINCNPEHQCADMVEAVEDPMSISQVFYPYKGRNSYSPYTSPAFLYNDGTPSEFSLSDIKFDGDKVSFVVYNSADVLPKVKNLVYEVYQDAAILNWESDIPESLDSVVVEWGETSKSTKSAKVGPYEPGKYSYTIEGLSPTKTYSMVLTFKNGAVSGDSSECSFLTKALQSNQKPYIYLEYLSYRNNGNKFDREEGLPLRVFNAVNADVVWYYNGEEVKVDGSGRFHPTKSGTLKAEVFPKSGSKEILQKTITLL